MKRRRIDLSLFFLVFIALLLIESGRSETTRPAPLYQVISKHADVRSRSLQAAACASSFENYGTALVGCSAVVLNSSAFGEPLLSFESELEAAVEPSETPDDKSTSVGETTNGISARGKSSSTDKSSTTNDKSARTVHVFRKKREVNEGEVVYESELHSAVKAVLIKTSKGVTANIPLPSGEGGFLHIAPCGVDCHTVTRVSIEALSRQDVSSEGDTAQYEGDARLLQEDASVVDPVMANDEDPANNDGGGPLRNDTEPVDSGDEVADPQCSLGLLSDSFEHCCPRRQCSSCSSSYSETCSGPCCPTNISPSRPCSSFAAPCIMTVVHRVSVFYTDDVARNVFDIAGLVRLAVAETNAGYEASKVPVRLALALMERSPLADNADSFQLLMAFRGTDRRSGNVGVLLSQRLTSCGRAFLDCTRFITDNCAYAVVRVSCATGYYSFGHEIGHIQGLDHNARFSSDPNSRFTDNHGHVIRQGFAEDGAYRTVMAYSVIDEKRILLFSNPDLEVEGFPAGVAGEANNARVLRATRYSVARLNNPTGPIATTLPPGVDVFTQSPTVPTQSPTIITRVPTMPTLAPTIATRAPTLDPTLRPTRQPTTLQPTFQTASPTFRPTLEPTDRPTKQPTNVPTDRPSRSPTNTASPTFRPSATPSRIATRTPTVQTGSPTFRPSFSPTRVQTRNPTQEPTKRPVFTPGPTAEPTLEPTMEPTTLEPTPRFATLRPTSMRPTKSPVTPSPTLIPTDQPTRATRGPTNEPTVRPTRPPTTVPSNRPSVSTPTFSPSGSPTTSRPSRTPSKAPSTPIPTRSPTRTPTKQPSSSPTTPVPSRAPSSSIPTASPTLQPSSSPVTPEPTEAPTSKAPTMEPSRAPSTQFPSQSPSTKRPTRSPTEQPSQAPAEPTPAPVWTRFPTVPAPTRADPDSVRTRSNAPTESEGEDETTEAPTIILLIPGANKDSASTTMTTIFAAGIPLLLIGSALAMALVVRRQRADRSANADANYALRRRMETQLSAYNTPHPVFAESQEVNFDEENPMFDIALVQNAPVQTAEASPQRANVVLTRRPTHSKFKERPLGSGMNDSSTVRRPNPMATMETSIPGPPPSLPPPVPPSRQSLVPFSMFEPPPGAPRPPSPPPSPPPLEEEDKHGEWQ